MDGMTMPPTHLDTPCVEWTGTRLPNGYGYDGQTRTTAHRAAWIRAHGPLARRQLVCHRCDNPPCVRLDHLFIGGAVQNAADAGRKGRIPFIADRDVAAIVAMRGQPGRTAWVREFAKQRGITERAVWYVMAGQRRTLD